MRSRILFQFTLDKRQDYNLNWLPVTGHHRETLLKWTNLYWTLISLQFDFWTTWKPLNFNVNTVCIICTVCIQSYLFDVREALARLVHVVKCNFSSPHWAHSCDLLLHGKGKRDIEVKREEGAGQSSQGVLTQWNQALKECKEAGSSPYSLRVWPVMMSQVTKSFAAWSWR